MAVAVSGHAAAVRLRSEITHLHKQHARKIFAFCFRRLGNREEAEDATQVTFLNAYRALEHGTRPEFESTWLHTIAHNVCVNTQRSSYRRRLFEVPSDVYVIDRAPARGHDTDTLLELTRALRTLPGQQRRALLLREWQGFTYREVAAELGVSQAAVETLIFRARGSLAETLTHGPARRRKRGRPPKAVEV